MLWFEELELVLSLPRLEASWVTLGLSPSLTYLAGGQKRSVETMYIVPGSLEEGKEKGVYVCNLCI